MGLGIVVSCLQFLEDFRAWDECFEKRRVEAEKATTDALGKLVLVVQECYASLLDGSEKVGVTAFTCCFFFFIRTFSFKTIECPQKLNKAMKVFGRRAKEEHVRHENTGQSLSISLNSSTNNDIFVFLEPGFFPELDFALINDIEEIITQISLIEEERDNFDKGN